MQENLVGYLLNSLDDDTQRDVENYLRSNARARTELEVLRRALAPLAADIAMPPPPPGLAARTLSRVLDVPAKRLPRAPVLAGSVEAVRPFWRRMDYVLAASILFIAVGLGVQGVYQMQFGHAQLQCQENLRQFAGALSTYKDMRGSFPDVNAVEAPRPAAGLVVPLLVDAGALSADAALGCPNDARPNGKPLTLAELRKLNPREFESYLNQWRSYAYSLGFHDNGTYYGPGTQADDAAMPLMADGPPQQIDDGNSLQHSGRGQNVLYPDGHVRFLTSRTPDGQDDIYLNNAKRVAAGLHKRDAVLGGSWARP